MRLQIAPVRAMEILDSRSRPTLAVIVTLADGTPATAARMSCAP